MARNEEKSLTAINRWIAQKRDLERSTNIGGKSTYMGGALNASATYGPYAAKKRPKLAFEVETVKECEIWRTEIIRGCAKKVAEIQNAALGEHRIRDLNDEINKDLREKGHWEDRIKELGGPDYKAAAPKDVDSYGAELASHSGYKYFGAAKDLPGVRELFEADAAPEAPRKSRKMLFKNIQPDYYGWRDEEDGMLLLAEQQAEMEAVAKEVAKWKAAPKNAKAVEKAAEEAEAAKEEAAAAATSSTPAEERTSGGKKAAAVVDFKAYVDTPTMQDIEKLILAKKKEALLKKYASKDMQGKRAETSSLIEAPPVVEASPSP